MSQSIKWRKLLSWEFKYMIFTNVRKVIDLTKIYPNNSTTKHYSVGIE